MKSKSYSKRQKMYKMKGCSSKRRKGGSCSSVNLADYNLAYPAKGITFLPNPALAYTGGGTSISNLACKGDSSSSASSKDVLAYTGPSSAYPSQGPIPASQNWLGSQLKGGSCNCGLPILQGGSHRNSCKCTMCKKGQNGGNGLPYGQGLPEMKDIPYPSGLTGSPWKPPIPNWPGVDGVSGNRNHLSYNTYSPNDVSRQMVNVGANPPFSIGGGDARIKSKTTKKSKTMKKGKKKSLKKGGSLSNFLSQDLINLGRQAQFDLGSSYNALNGYAAPVNPLPWKDQLPNTIIR